MRRLVVRRRASRDLHEILIYSAREWGVDRAERYVRDLHAVFDQILRNPVLGSPLAFSNGAYRRVNVGSHAIFFAVTDTTVAIVRVLHQRMNAPRHLP